MGTREGYFTCDVQECKSHSSYILGSLIAMTNSQKINNFWRNIWKFTSDYWIDVPTGVIPLLIVLLEFFNSGNYSNIILNSQQRKIIEFWTGILIVALVILSFVFFVLQLSRSKRLSVLKEENEALKKENTVYDSVVYEHTDSFLSAFSRDALSFGSVPGCDERITIYVHDPKGYFVPIGRHSENPNLKKRGRSKYPDDEGFIARAWERNDYFKNDYSDPKANPRLYNQSLSADNLPADIVDGLKMKPTLLFGYRVKNSTTHEPRALIILEVTKSNRYKERYLQQKFSTIRKDVTNLIQRLEPILPIISEPKEFGL